MRGMARQRTKKPHPGVLRAIADAGSQQALADLLDCTQSSISKRLYGDVPVTAEWSIAVEKALKGRVSRADLRPDLWSKA